MEDARAARDSARADAYAALKGTPEARADPVADKAEASYRAARERCEPLAAKERSARITRAQAERARAHADARELSHATEAIGTDTPQRCADASREARERCSDETPGSREPPARRRQTDWDVAAGPFFGGCGTAASAGSTTSSSRHPSPDCLP